MADMTLIVAADRLGEFFPLLLQGFAVPCRVPCTVKELLCGQFGLSPNYVSERITTIFLDGKATDDIDEALVGDRSTVALSAAMPGLVGATMRRGGYYASMRDAITLKDQMLTDCFDCVGQVRVKLFNLLLTELGPEFLQRGILLGEAATADFLAERGEWFWAGCGNALLNGVPLEPVQLREGTSFPGGGIVRLSVIFRKED